MTNEEFQKAVLEQLKSINNHIDNLEGQTRENTDFIKALLHRTEELGAQNHNIGSIINKIEGKIVNIDETLNVIQTDLSYVVEKTAQHDRNFIKLTQIAK